MRVRLIGVCLPILIAISAFATAQTPPPSADSLLKQATEKAKAEHKAVLLSFHATWCSWCHRLENFLAADGIKDIISKRVELVEIDVMEHTPEKKAQFENPGWEAIIDKFDAKETGLPTFFVLNEKGETLASSVRPKDRGGNIGYPGEPDEIAHFLSMMKTAGCSDSELETMKAKLQDLAKSLPH